MTQPIPVYKTGNVLLELKDIHLEYEGQPVLKGVNASIHDLHQEGAVRGQVVGLLAPSGVGKTQLFKIIAGMQRTPFTGIVQIGEDQHTIRRGEVGVVAQSYPLFDHRTILGNMMVAIRGKDQTTKRNMAIEMLKAYDLAEKGHLYPYQLSGGQRQRAATAQQLLCSEHFLLMDEPFSGQDPVRVKKACKFITDVASQDTLNTIILVSQTIAPVVAVADTVWLLGRDRNETGEVIPGAYVKRVINLIDRGLAWQPNITKLPEFRDMVQEIEDAFDDL